MGRSLSSSPQRRRRSRHRERRSRAKQAQEISVAEFETMPEISLDAALTSPERAHSSSPHKLGRGRHRRSVSYDMGTSRRYSSGGGILLASLEEPPELESKSGASSPSYSRSSSRSRSRSRSRSNSLSPDPPSRRNSSKLKKLPATSASPPTLLSTTTKKPFEEMLAFSKPPKMGRAHKRRGKGHRRNRSDSGMDYSGYRSVESLLSLPTFADHDHHDPLGISRTNVNTNTILNSSYFSKPSPPLDSTNESSGDRKPVAAPSLQLLSELNAQRKLTPVASQAAKEFTPRHAAKEQQRKEAAALEELRNMSLFRRDEGNLHSSTPMESVVESLHLSRYGDSHLKGLDDDKPHDKPKVERKDFHSVYRRARHGSFGKRKNVDLGGDNDLHNALDSFQMRTESSTDHDGVIDFTNASLGSKKIRELCKNLRQCDFETLLLSGNRITAEAVDDIAKCISRSCLDLDLSHNAIGARGVAPLVKRVLISGHFQVMYLNLGACALSNDGAKALSLGLAHRQAVRRLNLSDNNISATGAKDLIEALRTNPNMEQLDLSWNNVGAAAVLAVAELPSLVDLNLSWNGLGYVQQPGQLDSPPSGSTSPVMESSTASPKPVRRRSEAVSPTKSPRKSPTLGLAARIANALAQNKTLLHIDLGANNFKIADLQSLAEGLRQNQTLLGLHFNNQPFVSVDAHGFLVVDEKTDGGDSAANHNATHKVNSGEVASSNSRLCHWIRQPHPLEIRDSAAAYCWICGGWREKEITVLLRRRHVPEKIFEAALNSGVNVHWHFDRYAGTPMTIGQTKTRSRLSSRAAAAAAVVAESKTSPPKPERIRRSNSDIDSVTFTVKRMMPPGNVLFYFSVVLSEPMTAEELSRYRPGDTIGRLSSYASAGTTLSRQNSRDESKVSDTFADAKTTSDDESEGSSSSVDMFDDKLREDLAQKLREVETATEKLVTAAKVVGQHQLSVQRQEVSAVSWLSRCTMQFTVPDFEVHSSRHLSLSADSEKCEGSAADCMNLMSVSERPVHDRFFCQDVTPRPKSAWPESAESPSQDAEPEEPKEPPPQRRASVSKATLKRINNRRKTESRQVTVQVLPPQFEPHRSMFGVRWSNSAPRDMFHSASFGARFIRSDWSFSKCATFLHDTLKKTSSERAAANAVMAVYKMLQDRGVCILRLYQFACSNSSHSSGDQIHEGDVADDETATGAILANKYPNCISEKQFISMCNVCGFTKQKYFQIAAARPMSAVTEVSHTSSSSSLASDSGNSLPSDSSHPAPERKICARALSTEQLKQVFADANVRARQDADDSSTRKMHVDNTEKTMNRFEWIEALLRILRLRFHLCGSVHELPESSLQRSFSVDNDSDGEGEGNAASPKLTGPVNFTNLVATVGVTKGNRAYKFGLSTESKQPVNVATRFKLAAHRHAGMNTVTVCEALDLLLNEAQENLEKQDTLRLGHPQFLDGDEFRRKYFYHSVTGMRTPVCTRLVLAR